MLDEEAIEREYLATSLRWSEFSRLPGESTRANREYAKLHKLLKRGLRLLPDRGEAALRRIARSEDLHVRIDAAACLLPLDEPFAIGLLEEIASRKGLVSLTAKMTLREWKKGKLREYLS